LKKDFEKVISDIFDNYDSYKDKEKKKIDKALNDLDELHDKLTSDSNDDTSIGFRKMFEKRLRSFFGGKKD